MTTTVITRLKGVRPPLLWYPKLKEATQEFLEIKRRQKNAPNDEELDAVVYEAHQILGRCVNPEDMSGQATGLVIGYVQSGKTLSFTTVMALAKDNGFGMVILLAGTQTNLKGQSENRLRADLGIEGGTFGWRDYENPTVAKELTPLGRDLNAWKSAQERRRRPVLITVLKHHKRIEELSKLLRKLNLTGIPTVVIDDESDQASPNTKAKKNLEEGTQERSSTYDRIVRLKESIPHHTYIQYTATPQANLLIGIADVLSPSFAELVSPGAAYVGGKTFFARDTKLCIDIPQSDIPSEDNILIGPPDSLQSALRFFLLGAALHLSQNKSGNQSMMVHPSQRTDPHADYQSWLQNLVSGWMELLSLNQSSSDYQEIAESFRQEHRSLSVTYEGMSQLEELMPYVREVLSDVHTVKVNSKADGERNVRWNSRQFWILIGGQKLDRGFTVEGLTVTYMPRPASQNADTLQQRARFFGYKKGYQGLCRIFLPPDVREIYASYVEAEEFVRDALEVHRGKPLADWKRDFILHRSMAPTRPSVVGRKVRHVLSDGDWWAPEAIYRHKSSVIHNRSIIREAAANWKTNYDFVDAGTFPSYRDLRKSKRNWLVESVPATKVLDMLLSIQVRDFKDATEFGAVLISLSRYANEVVDAKIDVFLMSELEWEFIGATGRSLKNGRLENIFSGRQPSNELATEKLNYIGDRGLRSSTRPSLQLRMLKLNATTVPEGELTDEIPWIGVHMCEPYAKDCVIEEI